jgi:hypothetical protein
MNLASIDNDKRSMMKIRKLVAFALAGLALSGLFAGNAGAEETQELTFCGPFPPAEEAYLRNPARTMQEIQDAWQVNKVRYCASAAVPADRVEAAARSIDICLESRFPWTKADAEACIALWYSHSGATEFRRQFKRHREVRGKRAKRGPAKRPHHRGLALASGLS